MVNKVILIGNLGRDSETRNIGSSDVTSFTVATTKNYKDSAGEWQQDTQWHDVVIWRQLELPKGAKVYVEGELTHRSWEDKDGNKRYKTEVKAFTVKWLNRPAQGEQRPAQAATGVVEKVLEDLPF